MPERSQISTGVQVSDGYSRHIQAKFQLKCRHVYKNYDCQKLLRSWL